MSDDINKPPTPAEVDAFIANLSDDDKKELRRQQLLNAAINRKPSDEPDWGSLSNEAFEEQKRKLFKNKP